MFQVLPLDRRGSFTVEAAVIIPFSLFIITGLITLSFSLFNRCSIERAVSASALRGSEQIFESNSVKQQTAEKAFGEILENNLLYTDGVVKEIEAGGGTVRVYAETNYKKWTFRAKAEKKIIEPVKFIRKYRKVKGVVKEYDAGGIQTGGS